MAKHLKPHAVAFLLLTCVYFGNACVMIGGPQPFIERAGGADIIVYGEVVGKYPDAGTEGSFPTTYKAALEVLCVLRGGPLQSRVNITRMGVITSCDVTTVEVFMKYIMLLKYSSQTGELVPQQVNMESAALQVTQDTSNNEFPGLCDVTVVPPHGKNTCPPEVPRDIHHPSCSPGGNVRAPDGGMTQKPSDKGGVSTQSDEKVPDGEITYKGGPAPKINSTKITPKKGELVSMASVPSACMWLLGATMLIAMTKTF